MTWFSVLLEDIECMHLAIAEDCKCCNCKSKAKRVQVIGSKYHAFVGRL